MRKMLYVSFCAVLALGAGCAITNYDLITDNDQVANGQGSGIVNTNGKAHIIEGFGIAEVTPDGTNEALWFVDQKPNGDRTLTTYNNFSTLSAPTFHDDAYCNPDRSGCAMFTAPDPEVGDATIFDYTYNINCDGISNITYVLSTSRYYGECGRAKMNLQDRIAFMNMGRIGTNFGMTGLFYDMNHLNTTIRLSNLAGFETTIPVTANVTTFLSHEARKGTIDLTHPGIRAMGNAYADFLQNNATGQTLASIVYNGITFSYNIGGRIEGAPAGQASHVRAKMNARY